jgi:hypothetical protein
VTEHQPPIKPVVVLSRAHTLSWAGLCLAIPCVILAAVPQVPFSGVYGATSGGGSLTGWDRHGGDNPAVSSVSEYGLSLSGYAPFGLEGLRVTELEASRDGSRYGVSLGWRQLEDQAGMDESRFKVQAAWRLSQALSAGAFATTHTYADVWWGMGLGVLARPHRAFSFGLAGESVPTDFGRTVRVGVGADVGSSLSSVFGRGAAWRASAEYFREFGLDEGVNSDEWRFAFGLRLHALLGLYAGYAPQRESASLGVAFGMGGFEGFSAMRRHSALGGTAVQGLGWGRSSRDAE